jgi:hypothetical protein
MKIVQTKLNIILIKIIFLSSVFVLLAIDPNPNPTNCFACTNTKLTLRIKNVLWNCSTTGNFTVKCYDASGFTFQWKSNKQGYHGEHWKNANYFSIPGSEITFTSCSFIYGGQMYIQFENKCRLYDVDGTYTIIEFCYVDAEIPKLVCNKRRKIDIYLKCNC